MQASDSKQTGLLPLQYGLTYCLIFPTKSQHLSGSWYIPDTVLYTLIQIKIFQNERGFSLTLKARRMQLKPGAPLSLRQEDKWRPTSLKCSSR